MSALPDRPRWPAIVLALASLVVPLAAAADPDPARALGGVVLDSRREPVEGAVVRLVLEDGGAVESRTTPFGAFAFDPPAQRVAALEVEAEGFELERIPLDARTAPRPVIVLRRTSSLAERLRREREVLEADKRRREPPAVPGADFLPLTDRWRIGLPHWERYPREPHTDSPYDPGRTKNPYRQNVLKGDYPIVGQKVFLVLSALSDTVVEARRLPTPSGASAEEPGSTEFFGDGRQLFAASSLVLSADLFHGNTAFRPFDWRLRATPVANLNHLRVRERGVVDVDVREGTTRTDDHLGLQELFGEARIATVSPAFDFVAVRAGIQPFNSDFRGFLFLDNEPGLRLFGNWGANRNQWNAAAFFLLEKDTNSGLNTLERRHQTVFVANYYRQDFLVPGYTVTASWHRNDDRAGSHDPGGLHFDANGFLARPAPVGDFTPHDLRVDYLGFGGDGHVGRVNLTHAVYLATGHEEHNPIAGQRTDVHAVMAAAEISLDRDWRRYKAAAFYASGDDDPLDADARGFDTILDSPNFAGGPGSIWQRQSFRLAGTLVGVNQRFSLVPSLRTSKDEGQANFVNPGLLLVNVGSDLDLTPRLKLSANLSYLRFDRTETLELLLFQAPVRKSIGLDLGAAVQYRPFLTDNVIVNAGAAVLQPGPGLQDLLVDETFLSAFASLTLAY